MRMMHPKNRPPCHDKKMEFYVTAYMLAVKGGFSGTVEEWLRSLKGPKGEKGDPWTWEDYTPEQLQSITEGIRRYTMDRLNETMDGVAETATTQTAVQAGVHIRASFAQMLREAVDAKLQANQYRGKPQRISRGNWLIWDPASQQYADTGIKAAGVGGAEGPQGNRGQPAKPIVEPGQYGFYIDVDGNLVVSYVGDTAPDFRIEDGMLILRQEV